MTKALFSLDMIINNTQRLPNEAGRAGGELVHPLAAGLQKQL